MWEALLERDGTPLLGFYRSWKKVAEDNMRRKMTQSISLGDTNYIPIIKKKTKRQDVEEEVTGFLSGSDDDMDDEERFKLKEERGKKNADQDNKEEMDENESDDGDVENDDQEELDDDDANDVSDEASDGDGDEVKDLRLEDFGDSDLEMNDEFGDDKKDESEDDDDSD